MPIVNTWLSALPMLADQLQVAVPVLRSPSFTSPTGRLLHALESGLPEEPSTKVTLALRTSPELPSEAGSPVAAVMSLTVALRTTVAELDVAEEVDANRSPV